MGLLPSTPKGCLDLSGYDAAFPLRGVPYIKAIAQGGGALDTRVNRSDLPASRGI